MSMQRCPKCDNNLLEQHDGSTVTVDIAHNHETVAEANRKLTRLLDREGAGITQSLRVIVGNGKIREDILARLDFLQRSKEIVRYTIEPGNRGAVLIQLKR